MPNCSCGQVAGNFYVYEYYDRPEPQARSMVSMIREDLRCSSGWGFGGLLGSVGPGWYPLNMYAFGRLMWNPDLTCEEIVQEFCEYYGRGVHGTYWNAWKKGFANWTTTTAIDWRQAAGLLKQALIERRTSR